MCQRRHFFLRKCNNGHLMEVKNAFWSIKTGQLREGGQLIKPPKRQNKDVQTSGVQESVNLGKLSTYTVDG